MNKKNKLPESLIGLVNILNTIKQKEITEKKLLFETLICLLNATRMFCIDNHNQNIKTALNNYIDETIKAIEKHIRTLSK